MIGPPPPPTTTTMQQQQQPATQQQLLLSAQPMMYGTTQNQPSVRRISHRHVLFLLGLCGLALSFVMFVVAFSVPAWVGKAGLWKACIHDECESLNVGHGPDWLDAIRGMETLALASFTLSLAVELYQDVLRSPPLPDNKQVEFLGFSAGLFGIIGVSIFGAHWDVKTVFEEILGRDYNPWFHYSHWIYLNWGFWLATLACILGVLSSLLVGISRVVHARHTTQALANLGVYPAAATAPPTIFMQPVVTAVPAVPTAPGYQAVPAYPYTYPAPAPSPHDPLCFVMVQGRMVPVYQEMPPSMTTSMTTTATPAVGSESALSDGQPSLKL